MQKPEYFNASFQADSALLSELGERLVAEPGVAFTELIKNAHDADATVCKVSFMGKSIIIQDDGHGMTKDEFLGRWMTIATNFKVLNNISRKFKRNVTGAKGVGRFATRFLGKKLKVTTIADDIDENKRPIKTKLIVVFDWKNIDHAKTISDVVIPCERIILDLTTQEANGTTLEISDLKFTQLDFESKNIRTELLKLASPYKALMPSEEEYTFKNFSKKIDPGFSLEVESDGSIEKDIANDVLENFLGRVIIRVPDQKSIQITIEFNIYDENNEYIPKVVHDKLYGFPNNIASPVYADIRYFPRRAGLFYGLRVNGIDAYSWVKEHKGISIFDRGFKMKPYGSEDDDWLHLDADNAHSERHWRSQMMNRFYPLSFEETNQPKINPMLNLPGTHQVIGAVFVQTSSSRDSDKHLIPSMDRMGFVQNEGYADLHEAVRFGIELLTKHDKSIILEREKAEYEVNKQQAREDIKIVIKEIEKSSALSVEDRTRLLRTYTHLADNIDEIEEYDRTARQNLEYMGLLGVVAGFMTHEYQSVLFELQRSINIMTTFTDGNPEVQEVVKNLQHSVDYFNGYIEYTTFFIRNINQQEENRHSFRAKARVQYILNTFKQFRQERKIIVNIEDIDSDLYAPAYPVAMYDGIIHNLYTNALKALIASNTKNKEIKILIWNEKDKHYIQVMDNGPGIPLELRKRIWDPLYTTTSVENNPLGSGMGLGLPMVKKIIESIKGKIEIIEPPKNFSTCFKIMLPFTKESK